MKNRFPFSRRPRHSSGNALVLALVTIGLAATLAFSAMSLAGSQRKDVRMDLDRDQARALADAGLHFAENELRKLMAMNPWEPLAAVDAALLDAVGNPQEVRLADRLFLATDSQSYGQFTVDVWLEVDGDDRNAFVTATGYFPNADAPRSKETLQSALRLTMRAGEVFDYGYFVNNWGWFYGNRIFSYGNARSNGQFDCGNYQPGMYGTPRYRHHSDDGDLNGYIDDNNDAILDGSDGGIYSGWDIVGADRVRGMGALKKNQHDFLLQIPMPNLSRLDRYEAQALASNSSVKLGGQRTALGDPAPDLDLMDSILGDDGSEPQNIVLIGTADQPLIVDGLVVVRGDVIIKGVVTGKGAIMSGRNVYVADDLTYLNPPSTLTPTGESEAASEAWLAANQGADFLGLYAKENLVLGNFQDALWRRYVGSWLNHDANKSLEDSGDDQIPNTMDGKDGIPETNDDDLLEGDGLWTTYTYTQEDADRGLIPAGFGVGDPIPGTGEDIDGDGERDASNISLADFDLSASLTSSAEWAGNMPSGIDDYSQLSSIDVRDVHGVLYTNHALALLTIAWGQPLTFFGSLVCRNEAIIGGVDSINTVYDRRLLGGTSVSDLLPYTPARIATLSWRVVTDGDVDTLDPRP